jgi:hypothetical protein
MLPKAHIGRRSGAVLANIDHYRELVGDGLIDEIMGQGRALIGIRICQINATANDGGVENAEVNMFQRGGVGCGASKILTGRVWLSPRPS